MSRIYWDSMLFVYWLEDHPEYAARMGKIHKRMQERMDTLCTSTFTLGEVLTGIYKRDALELADQVRDDPTLQVEMIPFTPETADRYARIAPVNASPADAIHLASAAQSGVDLFLTNDHRLQR